jgi:hypothetical protein
VVLFFSEDLNTPHIPYKNHKNRSGGVGWDIICIVIFRSFPSLSIVDNVLFPLRQLGKLFIKVLLAIDEVDVVNFSPPLMLALFAIFKADVVKRIGDCRGLRSYLIWIRNVAAYSFCLFSPRAENASLESNFPFIIP